MPRIVFAHEVQAKLAGGNSISHPPEAMKATVVALLHILLQTSQPLLGLLKDIIIFANREPQPILHNVCIRIREEFGRWNGGYSQLFDEEPAELEIPGSIRNMWWECVIIRELHLTKVGHDKVSAFGVRIGQIELFEDLREPINLALHFRLTLLPEIMFICLFKRSCRSFLQWAHAAIADSRMCCRHVLDQVLRTNQVAHSPPRCVEQLARGADRQGQFGDLRRQCSDASEWHIVECIIDFIGEDDDVVLDAEISNCLQLLLVEHLAHRIVRRINHYHSRTIRDFCFKLFDIQCPFPRTRSFRRAFLGWLERDVDDFTAWHFNIGNVLIKVWLEDNHFVARLDKAHECRQHALIGTRGDGDFFCRVEWSAEPGRVGIGDGFS